MAEGGDPAQAFEDLRAEVSVLRRAIESMPAAQRDARAPDYSADFGVLGKGLDEIGDQLRKLMKAPALVKTPEEQGQAIANAGAGLVRAASHRLDAAAQSFNRVAHDAQQERERLSNIIGQASTKRRHLKTLCLAGAAAFAIGLAVAPFIARSLPLSFKTWVAGKVMGKDGWQGGASLMQAADAARWQTANANLQLIVDNSQAVEACRAAAARTDKAQHCVVTVTPPPAQPQAQ
jgi:hypothetical protein